METLVSFPGFSVSSQILVILSLSAASHGSRSVELTSASDSSILYHQEIDPEITCLISPIQAFHDCRSFFLYLVALRSLIDPHTLTRQPPSHPNPPNSTTCSINSHQPDKPRHIHPVPHPLTASERPG